MSTADRPGWVPATLRAHRLAVGLSQEALADKLRRLDNPRTALLSASPKMIGQHERGEVYPGSAYRRAYSEFFGSTDVGLGFRAPLPDEDAQGYPRSGRDRLRLSRTDVPWQKGAADPAWSHGAEDDVNRRDLLEALALSGVGLAATPVLTPQDRLLALESRVSGSGVLSLVENQLQSIVAAYPSTPPRILLRQIMQMQRFTDGIAQLRLRPVDEARLMRLTGVGAGLRGWVHNNAGETSAARISLAEAYKRGELLDDKQLIAWTRYMQSIVEDYAGNPEKAEEYALDGLQYTGPRSPQRALILADCVAGVKATFGDVSGVDRAISEARELMEGLKPIEHGPVRRTVVADLSTCHPVTVATVASRAYARLGRPDRVREIVSEIAPSVESGGSHQRAYLRMDEALAVMRGESPDIYYVSSLAAEGLALATPFQTAHVGTRLDAILDAAVPFQGHAAVAELTEGARMWRTARNAADRPELEV